jgi:hypothetical protein
MAGAGRHIFGRAHWDTVFRTPSARNANLVAADPGWLAAPRPARTLRAE